MNRMVAKAVDHPVSARPVAGSRARTRRDAIDRLIRLDPQRPPVLLLPPADADDLVVLLPIREGIVGRVQDEYAAPVADVLDRKSVV